MKTSRSVMYIALAGIALLLVFIFLNRLKQPAQILRPEKVNLAVAAIPQTTIVHVAMAKGFFQEEGLDVTPQVFVYGRLAFDSLLAGKADFATVADTPIIFSAMKGGSFLILATIETSTRSHAIVGRKDRGVRTPESLSGKKIGVTPGTNSQFFIDMFFVVYGVKKKDVTIVDIKPDKMVDALAKGTVDAVATWNPMILQLQKILGENSVTFYGEEIYAETFNVVAAQELGQQRPEAIRRLLRALIRAEDFVADHPAESRMIVAEAVNVDVEQIAAVWDTFSFKVTLNQSLIYTLEDQSRWAVKSGLVRRTELPDYRSYIHIDGLAAVKPDAVRMIR